MSGHYVTTTTTTTMRPSPGGAPRGLVR